MNVYIRIKPPECFSQKTTFVDKNEKILTLVQKKYDVRNKPILDKHDFKFSKVFDIDYINEDIYRYFGEEMILNFLGGSNCTFYLYGQTGSGKTHSLLGYKEPGILHYVLNNLTKHISKQISNSCLKLKCYQLYYNKIYDIFSNNKQVSGYDNGNDNYVINGLETKSINNSNYRDLINEITHNRHVSVSSENDTSSRSHLIIEIKFGNNVFRLIDLAGSEKLKNVKNNNINENGDINRSILAWKECIRALKRKSKYIPYRGHLLTRILKSSFVNNSTTCVLGTVSCENRNSTDSLNTLKYMQDITLLSINKVDKKKMKYRSNVFDKSFNFKNIIDCKKKLERIKNQREDIINNMITRMTSSESKSALVDVLNKEIYILEDMRNKMI
uniref:Kinesin motor domain-containing protein n=1 Tax=viral metagenome TaxID=1070528 RepID=A0A6C0AW21_9ZZZZ|tara:strand:- start:8696 stop:9853 length:1158 start_codon:yes stop_codon:yes gene_type:complete